MRRLAAGTGSFSMMSSYSSGANVRDKRVGVPFLNQMHVSQPSLTSQEADEDSVKVSLWSMALTYVVYD